MTTISRFLKKYTINPENIPSYVEFNAPFSILIDKEICRLILESEEPELNKNPEMKNHFRKTYDLINPETNRLSVLYRPRQGVGRRYPEEPSQQFYTYQGRQCRNENYGKYWGSLTIHSKFIKNTIFHYLGWRDYDQKKGHPTILYELAKKNNITLHSYFDYIKEGGFEAVCEDMIDYYSLEPRKSGEELALMNPKDIEEYEKSRLSPSNIKDLFNKTIYGGGHPKWCDEITHSNLKEKDRLRLLRKNKTPIEIKNKNKPFPFYNLFYEDTKTITKIIWDNNIALRQKICEGMIDDSDQPFSKCRNKLMSQFCGIIENELTYRAYKYREINGLCPAKGIDWGYDGFTTPPPPPHTDHEFHLNAMNEYVRDKTGFTSVCFIEKEIPPKTILWSVIEARRLIVNALPAIALPVLVGEALPAPAEPSNKDEKYLVWKENFEKEWCKIKNTANFIRKVCNADGSFEKYVVQTEKQIRTAYNHEHYEKLDEDNGKKTKVKCVKEWLDDPDMLCYDDANMYPPPLVSPPNVLNLWRESPYANNWDYENPETAYEFDREGVQMWCDHLKVLCNHNKEIYDYVSCWVAHMFQKPCEKTTHIVFISEEGAGKNVFLTSLGDLLGAGKVLSTSSPERDVWGSFNPLMINAFLVNLNEVDKRNASGAEGKIKELITEPTLNINSKGKDAFIITSIHRFITSTNTTDPTKTHGRDRRNVLVRCSDEKCDDFAYFKKLTERFKNPITLRSLYACFMKTDISEWNFRKIPRTEYHKIIIEGNRPPLETFMESFTINHMDKEYVDYYGKNMLELFRNWKNDTGYSFDEKISEGTLIKRILLELKLPEEAIKPLGRNGKGIKRRYDINLLKKRYGIGVCLLNVNGNELIIEEDEAGDIEEIEIEDEDEN